MRLMFQLEVQEDVVLLLPGESLSDAKTCDLSCLSVPCPLCAISMYFRH